MKKRWIGWLCTGIFFALTTLILSEPGTGPFRVFFMMTFPVVREEGAFWPGAFFFTVVLELLIVLVVISDMTEKFNMFPMLATRMRRARLLSRLLPGTLLEGEMVFLLFALASLLLGLTANREETGACIEPVVLILISGILTVGIWTLLLYSLRVMNLSQSAQFAVLMLAVMLCTYLGCADQPGALLVFGSFALLRRPGLVLAGKALLLLLLTGTVFVMFCRCDYLGKSSKALKG